ncbi:MAG: bifunctional biotin--[acetyl-CoA-carboxylase] ligase/biotin operon repressor BirA [Gammaproteobacteria bacterium]|nr:bifunctional biotin--[acetyl-CoA-carboxylase] ligase/biotin operon repressor BirA [Gammaproteobacteria bacterium]
MLPMTHNTHAIIRALADGRFHSGEHLAGGLGVSRSAVWKHMRQLRALGMDIFRVPGRGYRLAAPLELLDAERLRAYLSPACRTRLQDLTVLDVVTSTNDHLATCSTALPTACLAELQTGGRGRRGRRWVSPFAANLYLSLAWQFTDLPPGFTALGMVTAVCVVQALRSLGVQGVALKWPNDLIADGRKLGGILVDMQGEPPGRVRAVIGVGVNMRMPAAAGPQIDQPWTDLETLTQGHPPGRNRLAAAVLEELVAALEVFAVHGFAAFVPAWRKLDIVAGQRVALHHQGQVITGMALGVDDDGALLLKSGAETRRFVSGDISLRLQP